jgi:hypothetical protein
VRVYNSGGNSLESPLKILAAEHIINQLFGVVIKLLLKTYDLISFITHKGDQGGLENYVLAVSNASPITTLCITAIIVFCKIQKLL